MTKMLHTTADVIEELGGAKVVAALFNHHPNAVRNWRSKGLFPPHTLLILSLELEKRGLSAPQKLWDFTQPPGPVLRDSAAAPEALSAGGLAE